MGVMTLRLEPVQRSSKVMPLVKSAVESEIVRLELAIEQANLRLKPFEEKYGISSEYFVAEMAAEDLEGQDDEYVQWAGEYTLLQRLHSKLRDLQEISYE
jgi:hypothetical protein